jgi:hypothetical protein
MDILIPSPGKQIITYVTAGRTSKGIIRAKIMPLWITGEVEERKKILAKKVFAEVTDGVRLWTLF